MKDIRYKEWINRNSDASIILKKLIFIRKNQITFFLED